MDIYRVAKRFMKIFLLGLPAVLLAYGCGTMGPPAPEVTIPPDNFKGLERVIGHPSNDLFPEASPDGKFVAYAAKKSESFDVYYFDPTQARATVIQASRHVSDDLDPAWGPNSENLFFTSSRLPTSSIWRVKAAGGRGVNQITVREDAHDFNPNISSDGKKIVFASRTAKDEPKHPLKRKDKGKVDPTLWIANVDGSRMTEIGSGNNPKYSPDGKRILFHALAGDNYDIWMINPDGSELTQITTHTADDIDAAWSPDGTMIAFSSDREGALDIKSNFDLWALDLEGMGITQLTFNPTDDGSPFWSKDGYIYFHSDRIGNYDIYRGKPLISWEK